jgi:DNA-binding transcriptional ArsR family regulator
LPGVDEPLRALAHPARRAIVRLVWSETRPAGELAAALDLAPATVSEHLKVLRKSGLVVLEKEGTWRRYRADRARVRALATYLRKFPDVTEE